MYCFLVYFLPIGYPSSRSPTVKESPSLPRDNFVTHRERFIEVPIYNLSDVGIVFLEISQWKLKKNIEELFSKTSKIIN